MHSVNARNLSSDIRSAAWLAPSSSTCLFSSSLSWVSRSFASFSLSSNIFICVKSLVAIPRPSPTLKARMVIQLTPNWALGMLTTPVKGTPVLMTSRYRSSSSPSTNPCRRSDKFLPITSSLLVPSGRYPRAFLLRSTRFRSRSHIVNASEAESMNIWSRSLLSRSSFSLLSSSSYCSRSFSSEAVILSLAARSSSSVLTRLVMSRMDSMAPTICPFWS
ncbi:MAG: hypothetical protein A4E30_01201 [Methanomassiliicoccales archaeon PtaB.Bin215]|nr:MAG: hypothetical protein A4E30_01201 [Methanomassiliicoccales archaeon PtaB.Bin215]